MIASRACSRPILNAAREVDPRCPVPSVIVPLVSSTRERQSHLTPHLIPRGADIALPLPPPPRQVCSAAAAAGAALRVRPAANRWRLVIPTVGVVDAASHPCAGVRVYRACGRSILDQFFLRWFRSTRWKPSHAVRFVVPLHARPIALVAVGAEGRRTAALRRSALPAPHCETPCVGPLTRCAIHALLAVFSSAGLSPLPMQRPASASAKRAAPAAPSAALSQARSLADSIKAKMNAQAAKQTAIKPVARGEATRQSVKQQAAQPAGASRAIRRDEVQQRAQHGRDQVVQQRRAQAAAAPGGPALLHADEADESAEDDEEANHGVQLHEDEDEDEDGEEEAGEDDDDEEGMEDGEEDEDDEDNEAEVQKQLKQMQKHAHTNPKAPAAAASSSAAAAAPADESKDGGSVSDPSQVTFKSLGVVDTLCEAAAALGWKSPSDIQRESLPYALAGRDIIGLAETGSGQCIHNAR